MMKAIKKLKSWSKKKKKRRTHLLPPPPPPPNHCCCCSCSRSSQPTAPPLPPWLHFEPRAEAAISIPSDPLGPVLGSHFSYYAQQPQLLPSDTASEITPLLASSPAPASYQQYLAPEPVPGLPILPVVKETRAAGLFGCAASVGTHLIRCFCPCFQYRSLYS